MTNHPNRGWRRRWVVDLPACIAKHKDGWAFFFSEDTNEADTRNGILVAQPAPPEPMPEGYTKLAARIAREADEIYIEHLRARH